MRMMAATVLSARYRSACSGGRADTGGVVIVSSSGWQYRDPNSLARELHLQGSRGRAGPLASLSCSIRLFPSPLLRASFGVEVVRDRPGRIGRFCGDGRPPVSSETYRSL